MSTKCGLLRWHSRFRRWTSVAAVLVFVEVFFPTPGGATSSPAASPSNGKEIVASATAGWTDPSDEYHEKKTNPVVTILRIPRTVRAVRISPESLEVDENSGTAHYTVVLTSRPTGKVTVTATSDDPSAAKISPASLTFTRENWNTTQPVRVTGVNDALDNPDDKREVTITHTVEGGDYDEVDAPDVAVTVTDDDEREVTVSPTALEVAENGGDQKKNYTVALASQPTSAVTVTAVVADATIATISPAGADPTTATSGDPSAAPASSLTLTFTPANWNQPQPVTVTGVNDALDNPDDKRTVTITHAAAGGDYKGIDVPDVAVTVADDDATPILFVEKTAFPARVDRGELVAWRVEVRNSNEKVLVPHARLKDTLPPGFRYMPGSARVDGKPLADPDGGIGPVLTFALTEIGREKTELSYVTRAGPATGLGRRTNRAQAFDQNTGRPLSKIARAEVTVTAAAVFREEGVIAGKVFLDCDGDGSQTPGADEPGVPGVRIVFENGVSVTTDAHGRYSVYGFRPVTHIARLDPASLPAGAQPIVVDNRQALDPESRFVDPRKGELHRADFALGSCNETVQDAVAARVRAATDASQSLNGMMARDFVLDPRPGNAAERHGVAHGSVDVTGGVHASEPDASQTAPTPDDETPARRRRAGLEQNPAGTHTRSPPSSDPPPRGATPRTIPLERDLEAEIKTFKPALGFVDLTDGDLVDARVVRVRVKGPASAQLALRVNGEKIDAERIGKTVVWQGGGVAVQEYVAVRLRGGANRLEITETDPFGNERGRTQIEVTAPGPPARLSIVAPEEAVADGRTPVRLTVRVLDRHGNVSRDPAMVTLKATAGRFDVVDVDNGAGGVQVLIDDGAAVFAFIPPDVAGTRTVTAEAGFDTAKTTIWFLPHLRPMIAVGVVEGGLGERRGRDAGHLMTEDALSPFEHTEKGVNASLYMKGRVRDDYLLTFAYDSDKDKDAPLFRGLDPDVFYPIYGDGSARAFDAQSAGRLYARLEKGLSYAQWGDFSSIDGREDAMLGGYARKLTGGKAHIERGPLTVDAFAAPVERAGRRIEEIPASGVSSYQVPGTAKGGILANSETVEIVTRDRERPAVILHTEMQTRLVDYSLGYFDNMIVFNRQVRARDDDGNPRSIRIAWDQRTAAGRYWVSGASGRLALSDAIDASIGTIQSNEPDARLSLHSAGLAVEIGEHGWFTAEIAHSDSQRTRDETGRWTTGEAGTTSQGGKEHGWAARAEWRYDADGLEARLGAMQSGASFYSPNAVIAGGRREAGGGLRLRLREGIWGEADGLHTESLIDGFRRSGLKAGIEYRLIEGLSTHAGARVVDERGATGRATTTSGVAGLEWRPTFLPSLSLEGEYEQAARNGNRRYMLGGGYAFEDARLYAKHESAAARWGALGPQASGVTTVIGVEYNGLADLTAYSEYRARPSGASGNGAELSKGVRGAWTPTKGFEATARLEHISALRQGEGDGASVGAAVAYRASDGGWVGKTGGEWRGASNERAWHGHLGAAWRVDRDWSMLVQDRVAAIDDRYIDNDRTENRLRVGLAFRPADTNRVNALAWYEWALRDDENAANGDDGYGVKHLWALTGDWRPEPSLTLTGRYAGKWSDQTVAGMSDDYLLQQLTSRLLFDVTNRIDLGLAGSVLFEGTGRNPVWSAGVEGGYLLDRNVWLSVGYNALGYDEADLGDGYDRGVYFRARMKFDEDLFGWLQ